MWAQTIPPPLPRCASSACCSESRIWTRTSAFSTITTTAHRFCTKCRLVWGCDGFSRQNNFKHFKHATASQDMLKQPCKKPQVAASCATRTTVALTRSCTNDKHACNHIFARHLFPQVRSTANAKPCPWPIFLIDFVWAWGGVGTGLKQS